MTNSSSPTRPFMMSLLISFVIVFTDQVSKQWIVQNIEFRHAIPVVPFFSLAHAHNYGAAFGFLNNEGGLQTIVFTVIALSVSVVLVVWLKRIAFKERQLALALSLVLGGAIGNLIDRIRYDYVVDFLVFYYENWQFPAFNVADSAITVGAILLFMDSFGWKLMADRTVKEVGP